MNNIPYQRILGDIKYQIIKDLPNIDDNNYIIFYIDVAHTSNRKHYLNLEIQQKARGHL
jgi:hypothetical protein